MNDNTKDEGMIVDVLNKLIANYGIFEKDDVEDLKQELYVIYYKTKIEIDSGKLDCKLSTAFYNKVKFEISNFMKKFLSVSLSSKDFILLRTIKRLEFQGNSLEQIISILNPKNSVRIKDKILCLSSYSSLSLNFDMNEEEPIPSSVYNIILYKTKIDKFKEQLDDLKLNEFIQLEPILYEFVDNPNFNRLEEKYGKVVLRKIKKILKKMIDL